MANTNHGWGLAVRGEGRPRVEAQAVKPVVLTDGPYLLVRVSDGASLELEAGQTYTVSTKYEAVRVWKGVYHPREMVGRLGPVDHPLGPCAGAVDLAEWRKGQGDSAAGQYTRDRSGADYAQEVGPYSSPNPKWALRLGPQAEDTPPFGPVTVDGACWACGGTPLPEGDACPECGNGEPVDPQCIGICGYMVDEYLTCHSPVGRVGERCEKHRAVDGSVPVLVRGHLCLGPGNLVHAKRPGDQAAICGYEAAGWYPDEQAKEPTCSQCRNRMAKEQAHAQ
jgi:hypothetical protein